MLKGITLCHKRLGLLIGDSKTNTLYFNKTIAVPAYSRLTIKKILSTDFKLQVLVGENIIYRSFNVKLKARRTKEETE